jgi:polyhydroxyalkanoate synthesis repressor PhaR
MRPRSRSSSILPCDVGHAAQQGRTIRTRKNSFAHCGTADRLRRGWYQPLGDISVAEKEEKAAQPIVIKKYANRRLYNTAKSSYVTLEHLAQMVRDGQDFVVNDAKTGEDITRSVLAQIIFDEEAKGQNLLPANFLRQLIRLYGDTLQGFVPGYLEASMETFAKNQERMREQVAKAFEANPALANFEALARTNMEWFEQAMRLFAPFSTGIGPKNVEGTKGGGKDIELEELKAQLAAMQTQLAKLVKEG